MTKNKKKQYYVVVNGRNPGIYRQWFGENEAAEQVNGFPEAIYKGFYTREEALDWLKHVEVEKLARLAPNLLELVVPADMIEAIMVKAKDARKPESVVIYTDGGAIRNPGPGGYGVVLHYGEHRKELSAGFRMTTNNRMELLACIEGLKTLTRPCEVVLYSDSSYVVNGIMKGWAKRWRSKGWMRNKEDRAENVDLWEQLLDLCEQHKVKFQWVKGHAGNPDNERCDELVGEAVRGGDLGVDENYEQGRTHGYLSTD